jgi:hypothetical protein
MQIVGDTLHTRLGDCYKANVDDERNSGEDQSESSEDQRADPKTAVLAECRGGRTDHHKKGKTT